jgi:hypothetical protein
VLDTHNGVTRDDYSQLRSEPDTLIELVVERDREIAKLQNIIRLANQRTYGPKTEKLSSEQLALSFELLPTQPELPLKEEVVVEKLPLSGAPYLPATSFES